MYVVFFLLFCYYYYYYYFHEFVWEIVRRLKYLTFTMFFNYAVVSSTMLLYLHAVVCFYVKDVLFVERFYLSLDINSCFEFQYRRIACKFFRIRICSKGNSGATVIASTDPTENTTVNLFSFNIIFSVFFFWHTHIEL